MKKYSLFSVGLNAARANFLPGLAIQAAMLAVVLAYYWHPPFQEWLNRLALAKQNGGYLFSAIMSAIAGGILPELLCVVIFQRGRMTKRNLENGLFAMGFWSVDGVIIDALYRFQALLFGSGVDVATVAKKTVFDQFLFTPLFAIPFTMLCYQWKHDGYSFRKLGALFTWQHHLEKTVPTLIADWAIWIPLVILIYSLPPLLQIPLFGFALTFWVLIFSYISAHQQQQAPAPAPVVSR